MGTEGCQAYSRPEKDLISVGQLANEGYITVFQGDDWKISKGAMMVARGKKSGTLYMTVYARCSIVVTVANETPSQVYQSNFGQKQ